MWSLALILGCAAFLFGLVQWARSGAALWEVFKLSENEPEVSDDLDRDSYMKKVSRLKNRMKELESLTDNLLRSSFRVLGLLALFIWIFLIASVVIDSLGLDWLDTIGYRANRLWGDPSARSGYNASSGPGRNTILRSLGSGVRR